MTFAIQRPATVTETITRVAVFAPLPYSLQRLIWAAGIPFGIDADALHDMLDSPGLGSLGLLALVLLCEGTAAFTYLFVLSERRTVPLLGRTRMPPWLVVAPLLAPIAILAGFNIWTLQCILDGLAMPSEVGEGIPPWSFWAQVAVFWVWGVSLTIATAPFAVRAWRRR